MDWIQVLTIVGANTVLFFSVMGLMIKLHLHTDKIIKAIHEEMKDFHGRLCAIVERGRKPH
jgi:hypothetical protein